MYNWSSCQTCISNMPGSSRFYCGACLFDFTNSHVYKTVLLPDLNESHNDMFSIANHACRHISLPMWNQSNFGSLCLSSLKVLAMKGILLFQSLSICLLWGQVPRPSSYLNVYLCVFVVVFRKLDLTSIRLRP